MLKYIALLFNTVGLLIYQFFFADPITITQNVPATAKAESEFVVELTINKGATGGFAKLQQDLPEGFSAEKMESNGGTFTFSNQSVKFIWMSLPSDKEFKISYKIKVGAGAGGDKVIGGKFSYVVDNVKQSIDIPPATIKVEGGASAPVVVNTPPPTTPEPTPTPPPTTPEPTPTPTVTPTEPVVNNTPPPTTPEPTPTPTVTPTAPVVINTPPPTTPAPTTTIGTTEPSSVTCVRSVPGTAGNEFTVEVSINKGNMTGFAKFLETLPAGFKATAVESQGASFTYSEVDQKVKYVWVSMPSQPEFKVSYKVTVDPTVRGSQVIDGVFSFIENDETKKFVLPSSVVAIGGAGTTPPVVNNTPPAVTPTTPTEPVVNNTPPPTTPTKPLAATNIPSPQGNVNYRVQIMALHRAVEASTLAARYNINENVKTEMAEGFTKYTVGSHSEYKNARDAREEIKNKGVVGPFVTAYNTGKRITVQEALMISNQKWYR